MYKLNKKSLKKYKSSVVNELSEYLQISSLEAEKIVSIMEQECIIEFIAPKGM